MPSRYAKVTVDGRTVSAHRKVWEDANGPIPEGYIVHHRNGNKLDNRLENLDLLTHEAHSRHHNDKHPRERQCDVCKTTYAPHPTKRARSKTCSRPCMRELQSRRAVEREAQRRASRGITSSATSGRETR